MRSGGGGAGRTPRSTSCSSGWSTAWGAGCVRRVVCAGRSCCGCGSTTSRAPRARTRSARRTDTSLATARGLLAAARPEIERRGITLIGVALANLEDDAFVQLALPFDRLAGGALDATLDELRERFGAGAITRAVLLGRDQGPTVPLLPD